MDLPEINDRLNAIRKQSVGTYSGTIIKLVDMICDLIADVTIVSVHDYNPYEDPVTLDEPEKDNYYAKLFVPGVQADFLDKPGSDTVPGSEMSKPKDKTNQTANKGTARKANKNKK